MAQIGPVQLISIGFDRDANFEGRVIEELAKLESERTIRVLDVLFIARDTDSEDTGAIIGALLGFEFEGEDASPAAETSESDQHAFGFSQAEIQQMASGLGPGESAGVLLIEHVWARDLKRAFRDA